ncbi:MAG: F0F1 ATP synthase subunit A [Anaerolineae bacterium]
MKKVGILLVILLVIGLCVFSCILSPVGGGAVKEAVGGVVQPHIQMPAEFLHIGALRIPNSLLGTFIADLILIVGAAVGTRHIRAGQPEAWVPRGAQNVVEWIFEGVSGLLRDVLGERAERMAPFLITFFIFILVANWIELFPGFESIGVIEAAEGGEGHQVQELGPFLLLTHEPGDSVLLPFLRAANTDLNVPLALALVSVFMTQVYAIQEKGWAYFNRFINIRALTHGGPMGVMDFVVGLLETMSEVTKIISFAFRLFGNIFAGMVLLAVISSLVPFLAPVVFYLLEIFVGFIQAFVFMMLTAAFIAVATAEHDAH